LFRSLRINIFIFYLLTVSAFLILLYYALIEMDIQNYIFLAFVIFLLVILSAYFISKLAVDPLEAYVQNLQNLSKETLHELNLPISTIMTNIQMLQKSMEDKKNLKRVARIENASKMLQQRYSELDYLIKMQTKEIVYEHFFLDELIAERVEFLQKIYPYITFNLTLSKYELFMDKIGLSKVIDNIIDNAVKYSADSKIIDISIAENMLLITDYGIGMDEVQLLKIFDNYYQVNKDMQGFGIGLTIVKRFCDENSVELIFDSAPKIGTTVKLKFKKIQG